MAKMLMGEKNIPLLSCEEDIAEAFESIKENILWYKSMADRLREKVNYLESENYKDEELQKMKAQLEKIQENYRRGFPITKESLMISINGRKIMMLQNMVMQTVIMVLLAVDILMNLFLLVLALLELAFVAFVKTRL